MEQSMNRVRGIVEADWAHSRKIFGEGIGVAIVDTGVSGHIDLVGNENRITGFKDILNGREKM